MEKFKYVRPRIPENEIEVCLDMFSKEEAKKRICEFIKNTLDDVEMQIKMNETIHDVMCRLCKFGIHRWDTKKSKFGVPKNRTCKRCGAYEIYGTHTKWNKIR